MHLGNLNPLTHQLFSPSVLILLVPLILCAEAVWHDLKKREIPDNISVRLLATGLLSTLLSWHSITFLDAIYGIIIGFLVVLPFALREGIGGGDLKLVAALGAWLGVTGTLGLLFWTAISGMFVSIALLLLGRKDFPYAPAIFIGLIIALFFPSSLNSIVEWLRG